MFDPSSCAPSPALAAAQASAESAADTLRISELRYRRLFEVARDGILILDSEKGEITDANPFMTELLGYSRQELLGKYLWEIGLLQDKAASQGAFRRLKQDGYLRYENLPLENQRGEQCEVEFINNLYREEGNTFIRCNIRDITDRKLVAAELAAAAAAVAQHERQAAVLEERTRLAQEIHDTLAQGFAGIITQMEAAEASLTKAPELVSLDTPDACRTRLAAYQKQMEKVQIRIGKARDLARESLTEARRSVAALRSSPIETAPLPQETVPLREALAHFLTQSVLGTATQGRCVVEGSRQALSVSSEHCLLRIGQASITNAVQHAQAQEISVELFFDTDQVRLHIRDNGCGFDPSLSWGGRFGIVGMRERADKAGGQIVIVSRLGAGTEVCLTMPAPQETLTNASREHKLQEKEGGGT